MRSLQGLRVFAVAALAVGCGSRAGVANDAGTTDAPTEAAPSPAGRRSFDVTASLGVVDGGMAASLPPSNAFTLVLDAAQRRIIVGGAGVAAVVPVTTPDGTTFRAAQPFSVGLAAGTACSGITSITYKSFEVKVTGSTLSGKGSGGAEISCGDCLFTVPFSAVLAGTPDVTAPFLVSTGGIDFDPFTTFSFAASEPMPATATARLVAGDGSQVDLVPQIDPGEIPLVTRFNKPDLVLRYGESYGVALDGLVDFAGHTGGTDTALRLAGTTAPPLAAEDGFEAVTGATFGGASVVADPAFVIAGTRSLYFGGDSAPPLGTVAPGGSFTVRLAVQPGDTKVRFSARGVGTSNDVGFAGRVNIGSVGHVATSPGGVAMFTGAPSLTMTPPMAKPVYMSPPQVNEYPLPDDHSDEVIVSIIPSRFDCGPSPLVNGLIIDDLRAE